MARQRKIFRTRLMLTTVLMLITTGAASTVAEAETTQTTSRTPGTTASLLRPRLLSVTQQDLQIVGWDRAVAHANGYRLTVDAHGRTTSTPETAAAGRSGRGQFTRPTDQITGNCGTSYVYLYDVGPKKYLVKTGFAIKKRAIGYTWSARVIGPRFNHNTWRGALRLRKSMQKKVVGAVQLGGMHTVKASGKALLPSGAVCGSLGPVANEAIF